MKALSIQAGSLKGRKIPLPRSIHGHLHFTPSKLKEAVFSILESLVLKGTLQKKDSVFVDLFGGSGQMGLESYSRGFENVIIVEIEKLRFQGLLEFSNRLGLPVVLHNKDSFRFIKNFHTDKNFTIFFVDPPYSFWENQFSKLEELLSICKIKSSVLIVQTPPNVHLEGLEPREIAKNLLWTGIYI